jgi:membrane protease YdiL (CAAX protease family)
MRLEKLKTWLRQHVLITFLMYFLLSEGCINLCAGALDAWHYPKWMAPWLSHLDELHAALWVFLILWTMNRFFREQVALNGFTRRGLVRETLLGFLLGAINGSLSLLCLLSPHRVWSHRFWEVLAHQLLHFPVVRCLLFYLIVSLCEEAEFRSYATPELEKRWGTTRALVVGSLAFGLRHLYGGSHSLLDAVEIALHGGVCYCAAYILTRRIWLSIGLHTGWNFAGALFFGEDDLGIDGMIAHLDVGLSQYLLSVFLPFAVGIGIAFLAARRGQWRAPNRRLSLPARPFDALPEGQPP